MLSYSEYMFAMILSGDAQTRPVSVVRATAAVAATRSTAGAGKSHREEGGSTLIDLA